MSDPQEEPRPTTPATEGGQPAEFVDTPGNEPGAQATQPHPDDEEPRDDGRRRSGEPPLADGQG